MKSVTWLVDIQIIKPHILQAIRDAVIKYNYNLVEINLKESSEINISSSDIVIPYGTTHLVRRCMNEREKYSLYFQDTNFTTQKWVKELGERMLNYDAQYSILEKVFDLNLPDYIFVKPDSDLKSFTGSVVNQDGLQRFYDKVKNNEFPFDLSLPVVINGVKNTGWEWRLFMIKDQVIASSSYKLKEMINIEKTVPQAVIKYAQESARIWHPEDIYVMDICESDNGLKIVEFNCFHASGIYNCDVESIIIKVSEYIKSL